MARLDKFIPPFIDLIEGEFKNKEHRFWIAGPTNKYPVGRRVGVYICGDRLWDKLLGYTILIWQLHKAEKIVLHGLFNIGVILVLALFPWVLAKCHWVIWGADLYAYKNASSTWQKKLKEPLRRFVIRRIGHLVTYLPGDVELAREWYGATGVYHECLMYLSNVVDPSSVPVPFEKSAQSGLNILLGNSSDPSNNHIDAMERLLRYRDKSIKIYAPLSYGDERHASKVIQKGQEWFGERFVPITDFMPFDQYLDFLKNIDIAVFNHQRQQAMGNIIMLLGMGKKVFMASGISHWRLLNSLGIKMNDIKDLRLQALSSGEAQENSLIVRSYFSKSRLIKQLADLFEG